MTRPRHLVCILEVSKVRSATWGFHESRASDEWRRHRFVGDCLDHERCFGGGWTRNYRQHRLARSTLRAIVPPISYELHRMNSPVSHSLSTYENAGCAESGHRYDVTVGIVGGSLPELVWGVRGRRSPWIDVGSLRTGGSWACRALRDRLVRGGGVELFGAAGIAPVQRIPGPRRIEWITEQSPQKLRCRDHATFGFD
jgi:hypothetical protein